MNEFVEAMIMRVTEGTISEMVSVVSDYKENFITATEGYVILPDYKQALIRAEIIEPEDGEAYLKVSFRNKKGWEICCKGSIEESYEVIKRVAETLLMFYKNGCLKVMKQHEQLA